MKDMLNSCVTKVHKGVCGNKKQNQGDAKFKAPEYIEEDYLDISVFIPTPENLIINIVRRVYRIYK